MSVLRFWRPPLVSEANLFSYLVTRPTGRAVRSSIESQVAQHDGEVLTVLDFRNVAIIDYSCADEVVAELAFLAVGPPSGPESSGRSGGAGPRRRFVLIRGLEEHHRDPIDFALRRRRLAVAAERADGKPVLLGAVDEPEARLWRLVCEHESIGPKPLAGALGLPEQEARVGLEALYRRRLVLRREGEYVSFRRVLAEAARRSETGGPDPELRGPAGSEPRRTGG